MTESVGTTALLAPGSDHTQHTDDLEANVEENLQPLATALMMPEKIETRSGDRMVVEGDLAKIMTSSPDDKSVSLKNLKEDTFAGSVRTNDGKIGAREWFRRHLAMKLFKGGSQN